MDAPTGEQFGAHREQRAVYPQIGPVRALTQFTHECGRLTGTERYAQRVCGVERAAACSAVSSCGIAPDHIWVYQPA